MAAGNCKEWEGRRKDVFYRESLKEIYESALAYGAGMSGLPERFDEK